MDHLQEIRAIEFLLRASPHLVYEWFEKQPSRKPDDYFLESRLSREFEGRLLARNEPLVDLALAMHGTNSETLVALYSRWCSRSSVPNWPPRPHSFPYSVLASAVSNVNEPLVPWSGKFPDEELESLIANSECDDDLFRLFFSNATSALGYLKRLANREGVFATLTEERWLRAIAVLGRNKGLHVSSQDSEDGPDMLHWSIHEHFARAAEMSPKNRAAATTFGYLFSYLPSKATKKAYINDENIRAAVDSWNVELTEDPEDKYSSLKYLHKDDSMGPAERIRFHLLRHYEVFLRLDPDDTDRVRRLAAYAKNTVGLGKAFGTDSDSKWRGKALDESKFKLYADRDGAAFLFASSYSKYIWSVPAIAEKLRAIELGCEEPEDTSDIYRNRKCAGDPEIDADEPGEKVDSIEQLHQKFVEWFAASTKTSTDAFGRFESRLSSLKAWVVVVAILALVLLIFKH